MKIWASTILCLILLITGCSSDDQESQTGESNDSSEATSEEASQDGAADSSGNEQGLSGANSENAEDNQNNVASVQNQMMIYNAQIELETENYDDFNQELETRMQKHEAYMVESTLHNSEEGNRQATIKLRIPQENFDPFIEGIPSYSDEVISKNVSGRDVTEQYVDLESRLEAKEKIESRLMTFLDEAGKTEDLISISQDLERVQEEIEVIKGKMNYLDNQSDFSTITLNVTETKVVVPGIENQQLNTWEKTKQTFMTSINGLSSFFSWVIITVVGYSPVLIPVLIVIALYWLYRRRSAHTREETD
ncbi:DUF4349 domain-containing protein [Thalassobacillus sp. CUG 92003]|uniref:DUF4349 domain-containing protein n=1 Tax=Thalassobacillus sp. CUG 92003 TaxID=2736641 RepID=UPI0015E757C1|nr:DUF4349 domain-containing protein [Thalassobacillus sp. CUG 92003]